MGQDGSIFTARVLRKQDDLPRYIVVAPEHVPGRTRAFLADVTLNGSAPFERNIRPWGKGSDVFFFNLTAPQCLNAGVDTGDECQVMLSPKADPLTQTRVSRVSGALLLAATLTLGAAPPGLAQDPVDNGEVAPLDLRPDPVQPAAPPVDDAAQTDGEDEETADDAGETIVISEAEARVCAARLEPLASSFDEPTESMYLQRLGPSTFRVWAPRGDSALAPSEPWCVTTLTAIAETSFLNTDDRTVVMELVAGARPEPPEQKTGPDADPDQPPPTVIVEDEEEDDTSPLPAAFQRLPPRGGRSAARIGVPVPVQSVLGARVRMVTQACLDEPRGQPTAVFDRHTGRAIDAECRLADGTSIPLPHLAVEIGAR